MRLILHNINHVFDLDEPGYVNCLVIENQKLLYETVMDLKSLACGEEGKSVISADNKILSAEKYMEVIDSFVPFDINQKSLINKVAARLSCFAVDESHYVNTMELISVIESYLMDLSANIIGNIDFTKLSPENIIKNSGIEFIGEYESVGEKLLDYFELVTEYERKKIFALVNIRSYISNDETERFFDSVLRHGHKVFLIENTEYLKLNNEKRIIVDKDLCEVC